MQKDKVAGKTRNERAAFFEKLFSLAQSQIFAFKRKVGGWSKNDARARRKILFIFQQMKDLDSRIVDLCILELILYMPLQPRVKHFFFSRYSSFKVLNTFAEGSYVDMDVCVIQSASKLE